MAFRRSPLASSELEGAGGAYVRRAFQFGERALISGNTLTQEELASIPLANLRALVNTGKLELWPQSPDGLFIAERFIVPSGHGKYHVIEGRRITTKPILKEEAKALAKAGRS